jgi:hypothetical protein
LSTKKGTASANLDQGVNMLKLEKGVAKNHTIDFKDATLDLVWLAVDFGTSQATGKRMLRLLVSCLRFLLICVLCFFIFSPVHFILFCDVYFISLSFCACFSVCMSEL